MDQTPLVFFYISVDVQKNSFGAYTFTGRKFYNSCMDVDILYLCCKSGLGLGTNAAWSDD
jgi:hypothetical protein